MDKVTEEEMLEWWDNEYMTKCVDVWGEDAKMRGAIRRLIEHGPEVDEKFVKEWAGSIAGDTAINHIGRARGKVEALLRQAGVKVKEGK